MAHRSGAACPPWMKDAAWVPAACRWWQRHTCRCSDPAVWDTSAMDSLVSNVSDTARWVTAHRAKESARPDALFHDPLAERLAGEQGHAIIAAAPRSIRHGWWLVARTKIIDDLIATAISQGCDRVLNLAAGLDTRPY